MRSPNSYSARFITGDRGFLAFEALLAVSIGALMLSGTAVLVYMAKSAPTFTQNKLTSVDLVDKAMGAEFTEEYKVAQDTILKQISDGEVGASLTKSNLSDAIGRSTCESPEYQIFNEVGGLTIDKISLEENTYNQSTAVEVRNGIAYTAFDSPVYGDSDLVISGVEDGSNISRLNTGPGASALSVAGPYIYLGNTGSTAQLQVVDIHDRSSPHVVASLKLPLPLATSSPPRTRSLEYYKEKIYLGTEKWDGPELSVIDVSDPTNPRIIGSFEIGTVVTDILAYGDTIYVTAADRWQLRIIDGSDLTNMSVIKEIGPVGWQTQEGRVVERATSTIYLGRTVGGFNNTSNHELFTLIEDTVDRSVDVPGGIYDIVPLQGSIYLATGRNGGSMEVWSQNMEKVDEFNLHFRPVDISCDHGILYVATGNSDGLSVINIEI